MNTIAAVVIGAGPAGLAMSRCLTEHNIEHVVLERSAVANSWRSERWDSLRLLTPNWMTRLPGYGYHGADPDGYMTAAEVVELLDEYATQTAAAVLTGSPVERVTTAHDGSFVVATGNGSWRCRAVVVATGACSTPKVPSIAGDLPGHASAARRRSTTGVPTTPRANTCSSSVRQPPGCSSPRSSRSPGARSRWRSAHIPGCRGPTGG